MTAGDPQYQVVSNDTDNGGLCSEVSVYVLSSSIWRKILVRVLPFFSWGGGGGDKISAIWKV